MIGLAASRKGRWLLPALAALLLSSLPVLTAAWLEPAGTRFMGAVFNSGDASAYLAGMRQGAAGATRYTIPFTPEAVVPRFMYSFYLALGQLQAALGGGQMAWWHAARVAGALIAVAALALLIWRLRPEDSRWQTTAYFLALFGGGAGWLFRIAARFTPLPPFLWPDVALAEWSPVLIAGNPPHFGLGLGLLALLLAAVAALEATGRSRRWGVVATMATAMLGLIYPYAIPLAAAILGAYVLVEVAANRRVPWSRFVPLMPAALLILLFGYYYGFRLADDPLWARLNIGQNFVPPPPPIGVLTGLGLVGLLAILGLRPWLRHGGSRLVPAWALVQTALLALPLPYAGRFAFGLTIPYALLAAAALEWRLFPNLPSLRRLRPLLLLILSPSLLLGIALAVRSTARTPDWPIYAPEEEIAAMTWLAGQGAESDVVLAYHQIGNWLPRFAPGRVFVGQKFATIAPDEKAALVVSFWHEDAPPGWRDRLLDEWSIDWVYYGRYEKAITTGAVTPPGTKVYDDDGVAIYRIHP